MPEISATEAARNFAELLDAVEFKGERVTIIRRGRAVAVVEPVVTGHGANVKSLLRRHRTDGLWAGELEELRKLATTGVRF